MTNSIWLLENTEMIFSWSWLSPILFNWSKIRKYFTLSMEFQFHSVLNGKVIFRSICNLTSCVFTSHLFTANALMIIFEQFRTFFRSYFSQLSISSLMFVYLRLSLWCRRGDVGFVHLVDLNDRMQIQIFYYKSLSYTWYFLNWKWHKHHKKCKRFNATFVSLQLLTDFATKNKRFQRLPNWNEEKLVKLQRKTTLFLE